LGAKLVFLPPDHQINGGNYSLVFTTRNQRFGCWNIPSASDSVSPGSRGGNKGDLAPGVAGVSNRGGNKGDLAPEVAGVSNRGGKKGDLAPED